MFDLNKVCHPWEDGRESHGGLQGYPQPVETQCNDWVSNPPAIPCKSVTPHGSTRSSLPFTRKTIWENRTGKNTEFVENVATFKVLLTIHQIRGERMVVRKLEKAGRIKIINGNYNLDTGTVEFFEYTRTPRLVPNTSRLELPAGSPKTQNRPSPLRRSLAL